jgi:hypothetical protein
MLKERRYIMHVVLLEPEALGEQTTPPELPPSGSTWTQDQGSLTLMQRQQEELYWRLSNLRLFHNLCLSGLAVMVCTAIGLSIYVLIRTHG